LRSGTGGLRYFTIWIRHLPELDVDFEPASCAVHERESRSYFPSLGEYTSFFGLTKARAARLREDCHGMHPGPINRGVEIDSDVADSPRSVILDQVTNGLAVRNGGIVFVQRGEERGECLKFMSSSLLFKNGRVIDPANARDAIGDVLIVDGRVAEPGTVVPSDAEVIDCKGLVVAPGLVDLHVHFREPGQSAKGNDWRRGASCCCWRVYDGGLYAEHESVRWIVPVGGGVDSGEGESGSVCERADDRCLDQRDFRGGNRRRLRALKAGVVCVNG